MGKASGIRAKHSSDGARLQKHLKRRQEVLEKIGRLSIELCAAVDLEAEDIGGSRPSLTILQELGPLTSELERLNQNPDEPEDPASHGHTPVRLR